MIVPPAETDFRLVTWNVHMGLHNDGGRNDVVGAIAGCDADIVVLQEAWWFGATRSDLVDQVAEAIGGIAHAYVSSSPVPTYPVRRTVAIVTRLSAKRLPDLALPARRRHDRRAVHIELTDDEVSAGDGRGITVAGMHLDGVHAWKRPDLFVRQQRAFVEHCAQADIVAGDLNMWARIVNPLARPLRPAARGRTWSSSSPFCQIDHVLVGDRIEILRGQVLDDMGSDHRALQCDLRVRPPGDGA